VNPTKLPYPPGGDMLVARNLLRWIESLIDSVASETMRDLFPFQEILRRCCNSRHDDRPRENKLRPDLAFWIV